MNKIIFFDIDGTLLDVSRKMLEPHPSTFKALQKCRENNIKLFIATSRGVLPEPLKKFKFDGYIFCDGHKVIIDDEVIIHDKFSYDDLRLLSESFEKNDGAYYWYGEGKYFNKYNHSSLMQYHSTLYLGKKIMDFAIKEYDLKDVSGESCCAMFESVEKLENTLSLIEGKFAIHPYRTGCIRMDVYPLGYDKGGACKYVYEKLGYKKEDTIAFGDGLNDIEMFKNVGLSIALENACDELKKHASFISKDVEDNPIEYALKQYGLI